MIENKTAKPKFIYCPARSSTDYQVIVDEGRVGDIFKAAGVRGETIGKTSISFIRDKPSDAEVDDYAAYNILTRNIEIYTDEYWGEYKKCRALAEQVINGNKAMKSDDFDTLLAGETERTLKYLATAPATRASLFIDKLLMRAMHREVNIGIAHEIQHVKDHSWALVSSFTEEAFSRIGLGGFWYGIDPFEKRAERFEKRMVSKLMERPMVSLILGS